MHAGHVHESSHLRSWRADDRMAVDQRQGYVAQDLGKFGPVIVSWVHEVLVGQGPVPGQIDEFVHDHVQKRGHGVRGALNERHVRREHAGQVRQVGRVEGVFLPLRHPRVGCERQHLHQMSSVLVPDGGETLVIEVFEHDQVKGRPVVFDEVHHGRLVQRQLADVRPEPPQVHGRGYHIQIFRNL